MKKTRTPLTASAFVILLTVLVATHLNIASANPLNPPFILVSSPKNYETYYSTEVPLNFTRTNISDINFTSFTYVLDGNEPAESNGTSLLTGLSAGSHKIVIYGRGYYTDNEAETDTLLLETIHFNVFYSIEMVILIITFSTVVSILAATIYLARQRLRNLFGANKTKNFGVGFALLITGVSFLILTASWMVDNYLHPNPYSYNSYHFVAALTLLFTSSGVLFMKKGIKKEAV